MYIYFLEEIFYIRDIYSSLLSKKEDLNKHLT